MLRVELTVKLACRRARDGAVHFFCALSTFPNFVKLPIQRNESVGAERAAAVVKRVLGVLVQLPIKKTEEHGFPQSEDFPRSPVHSTCGCCTPERTA